MPDDFLEQQRLLYQHQQEMFRLQLTAVVVVAGVAIFVGAVIIQIFKPDFKLDTVIAGVFGGALTKLFVDAATAHRAEKNLKKKTDELHLPK